jgi:diketogulonate reductase-like aldo/keto reductase
MTLYQFRKYLTDMTLKFTSDIISGTKKVKYLEENVKAIDVKLSDAEVKAIREEVEKVEVVGERYPPFLAQYSFANTPEQ